MLTTENYILEGDTGGSLRVAMDQHRNQEFVQRANGKQGFSKKKCNKLWVNRTNTQISSMCCFSSIFCSEPREKHRIKYTWKKHFKDSKTCRGSCLNPKYLKSITWPIPVTCTLCEKMSRAVAMTELENWPCRQPLPACPPGITIFASTFYLK